MTALVIDMFDWVAHVPAGLEFLVLAGAAIAAFFMIRRTVIRPVKATWKRWNQAVDSLVGGSPEVLDPDNPNVVLKPATAPLSQRVSILEEAINKMLDLQEKQLGVTERLASLEEWRQSHETWSEEIVQKLSAETHEWQREHEGMHALAGTITHDIKNDNP